MLSHVSSKADQDHLVLHQCTKPLAEWEHTQKFQLESQIKAQRSQRKTEEKIIEGLRNKASRLTNSSEQQKLIAEISEREVQLTEPIVLPQVFLNDSTPEALSQAACEQGGRMALISDEGGMMETLAGLYQGGRANIDILLKGIDGGHLRIQRKDKILHLNPYLTIVMAVQPVIIQKMAEKRAYQGNGLFERFLYVLPRSQLGYRKHNQAPVPSELIDAYRHQIQSLLNIPQDIRKTLTLSLNALERWRTFQEEVEVELRPEGRLCSCQGWGGKICGFTLRLAGLLHVVDDKDNSLIAELTMAKAIKIAEALIAHALIAFSLMGRDQTQEDAKQVFEWFRQQRENPLTRTAITKALKHRPCGKSNRLTPALAELVSRHLISEPQKLPTVKPTTVYYLHPDFVQPRSQSP